MIRCRHCGNRIEEQSAQRVAVCQRCAKRKKRKDKHEKRAKEARWK